MAWEQFTSLNLRGGTLTTILDDDQDMLEIHYPGGMMIDVGYIEDDRTYYVTAVADESPAAWNAPLAEASTTDKAALPGLLQQVIDRVTNA